MPRAAQHNALRKPVLSHPVRIELDLVGTGAALFADLLDRLNAGKTPADAEWWTPTELAASLVNDVLISEVLAASRRAARH